MTHSQDNTANKIVLIIGAVTPFIIAFLAAAVQIALPAMSRELHLDAVIMTWVNTIYFLGLGMMNPSYRLELPNDPNSYNGRAIAVEWITYSSGRWKENINPIPDALDKLMQLNGVEFDWKAERGGHRDIGLIAEDVARVIPGVVHMEDDGVNARGLDYARLIPLLIEAIKAQQLEIEHLKQQVVRLSAQ